ncbi:MAG: SPOR domain-containing protein [Thermodesulfovibrionales bacterium]
MVMLCFFYDTKGSREIIPLLQSGKGIIIVITIVFSCLSFTLGFFVGKFGTHNRPEVSLVAMEPVVPSQNIQSQPPQNQLPAEPLKVQPELSATPVPAAQPQPRSAEPPARPLSPPQEFPGIKADTKPGPRSSNGPGHESRPEPARVERDAVAKQVKEVSKTAVTEYKQENKQASAQQKQDAPEPLYAVQLGAFRNKTEAEKFKAKYSKKGYKIYVEAVKANKNMKIYKLRTGEFREKKDAEILAVKLKTNENLKTFVVTIGK